MDRTVVVSYQAGGETPQIAGRSPPSAIWSEAPGLKREPEVSGVCEAPDSPEIVMLLVGVLTNIVFGERVKKCGLWDNGWAFWA